MPKPQDKHFPQQSTSACIFPYLRKAIDASGCGADGYAERLQKSSGKRRPPKDQRKTVFQGDVRGWYTV